MGLFSFSGRERRSVFHGGGYYTGGFLRSDSSGRYYDPRYASTRPSAGNALINAVGAALGGAVGAGAVTGMAGMGDRSGTVDNQGSYVSEGTVTSTSATVVCPRCSSAVPAGSKFCLECGGEIGGGFCSHCGQAFMPGAKFCVHCGAPR